MFNPKLEKLLITTIMEGMPGLAAAASPTECAAQRL